MKWVSCGLKHAEFQQVHWKTQKVGLKKELNDDKQQHYIAETQL